MNYPEIPPVELLRQLAPDVREYCLNKVNTYYREERNKEYQKYISHLISSGRPFYYTGPTGKPCVLRGVKPEDVEAIKILTKKE